MPPSLQEDESGIIAYVHLSCARRAQLLAGRQTLDAPVCKHWRARGFCLFAERCIFRHPPPQEAGVNSAFSSTVSNKTTSSGAAAAGGRGDAATAVASLAAAQRWRGRAQKPKIRNRFRAGMFRRWLIEMFSREALRWIGSVNLCARSAAAPSAYRLESTVLLFVKGGCTVV